MRDATWTAYAVIAFTAVAVQVTAQRRPQTVATIGRVVSWAMRRRSTQLGLLLAWWWLGWHLVTAR